MLNRAINRLSSAIHSLNRAINRFNRRGGPASCTNAGYSLATRVLRFLFCFLQSIRYYCRCRDEPHSLELSSIPYHCVQSEEQNFEVLRIVYVPHGGQQAVHTQDYPRLPYSGVVATAVSRAHKEFFRHVSGPSSPENHNAAKDRRQYRK